MSIVDKRTILEISKKMFSPKENTANVPESMDEDGPETEYLLRKYRFESKNVAFECFSDEITS